MIKTLIIEDEPKVKDNLLMLLGKYCSDVNVCAVAGSFTEAHQLVKMHSPQLLFTDIQLNSPEGNGIDFIQLIDARDVKVIFISGWKDYAAEAFRLNAVDYLLKPINIRQLIQAVEKVKVMFEGSGEPLPDKAPHLFLRIPTQHGFLLLKQQEIIRCEADGPYTHFYMEGKESKVTSSVNLGQVEKQLRKDSFFRIHRSHIINVDHMLEYHKGDGGVAKMRDRFHTPVARNIKEDFLKWLDEKM